MRRSTAAVASLLVVGATATTAVAVTAATQTVTTGKTKQNGGQVAVTVLKKPTTGKTYLSAVNVRFQCPSQGEGGSGGIPLYEAQAASMSKRYDYGKAFNVTYKNVKVIDAETGAKKGFKATVVATGKITKTSSTKTKGSGTVRVTAPGCSTGKLTWSGKGSTQTEG
jgi:hypothetical protein